MISILYVLSAAPVALVGDFAIESGRLEARLEATKGKGETSVSALLEDLINEEVLATEARRLGLGARSEVRVAVQSRQRALAGEEMMRVETDKAVIDDQLLRDLYHDTADAVRLEYVVLGSEPEAAAALERVKKGAAFSAESRGSLDPTTGVAERMRVQLEPAFAKAAFSAAVGVAEGPVPLRLGFAVFRVVERTVGQEAEFLKKRPDLVKFARQQLGAEYRRHLVEQLRKSVQVDEAFVKGLGARMEATPAESRRVLASVGGRDVYYGEILAEVRRKFGGQLSGHMSGPAVKLESLWSLIDVELLGQEAVKRGHGQGPDARAAMAEAERDALVRTYAAQLRAAARAPRGEELEEWYDDNREQLQFPARRACALFVADEPTAARARKRAAAGESLARLAAEAGGQSRVGSIPEEVIEGLATSQPALADAMKKPGALTGPISTPEGFIVVKCGDRIAAGPPSFDEARELALNAVGRRLADEAVRSKCRELRGRVRVVIDKDKLARLRP
ncbi:MAG: peptidyl-prolyl cis-trans isomerase [Deltaproteobacteria bacterium]|nr:peptidyl-prolyl cis-trans isomerase [Deltaproteobacteria bacterium]